MEGALLTLCINRGFGINYHDKNQEKQWGRAGALKQKSMKK